MHDHHHHHSSEHSAHTGESEISKNLILAFLLNFGFAIIEVFGGLWTNSVAILSDAVHDFGDSLALGMAWYLEKFSQRRGDHRFSYGYKRFSLLSALFISLVLLISSGFILVECIERLQHPQASNAGGMMLLALGGIVINGLAVLRLRHGKSINQRAVFLHMMEDVLGWVAVLIAGIVMYFWQWPWLDPLLSIGITLWILYNVVGNLRRTFRVLLQGTPADLDLKALRLALVEIPQVADVHDMHVWTLDGEHHVVTLHVKLHDALPWSEQESLKVTVRNVCEKYEINHVTIELEYSEICTYRDRCN